MVGVISGVSQRAILGSLLFKILINHLEKELRSNMNQKNPQQQKKTQPKLKAKTIYDVELRFSR